MGDLKGLRAISAAGGGSEVRCEGTGVLTVSPGLEAKRGHVPLVS